jgi:alpha/beta superfamily hydrolase
MFGGTMHNKVVYHAMKAFQAHGLPVLRFNFRGAGLSEGEHDRGHGEQDDVKAALDWLQREYGLPLLFAGFSFGSSVGLRACCGDERVKGMAALGLPVHAGGRAYHYSFLASCTQPKIFISGANDEFGPQAEVEAAVAAAAPPAELIFIPEADHFFAGKLEQMQQPLIAWVGQFAS